MISPKMVNARDTAGNTEEEVTELHVKDYILSTV